MLDIFVAALLSVADPTIVAQTPTTSTVAMSTLSKKPSPSQGYEKVYSACQDIDGYRVSPSEWGPQRPPQESGLNSFGLPFHEEMYKRWGKTPGAIQSSEWVAKVNLKITELEAPKHGKVVVRKIDHPLAEANNPFWDSYTFMPDLGYVGKDRVVYQVEAEGKRYKVILNFWVVPVVGRDADDVPECLNQKFNSSSIAPGLMIGGGGPPTNGTFNNVIGYTMGGIPFGNDIIRVDLKYLNIWEYLGSVGIFGVRVKTQMDPK